MKVLGAAGQRLDLAFSYIEVDDSFSSLALDFYDFKVDANEPNRIKAALLSSLWRKLRWGCLPKKKSPSVLSAVIKDHPFLMGVRQASGSIGRRKCLQGLLPFPFTKMFLSAGHRSRKSCPPLAPWEF